MEKTFPLQPRLQSRHFASPSPLAPVPYSLAPPSSRVTAPPAAPDAPPRAASTLRSIRHVLSAQQQYAVNSVAAGHNVFLTGPGGVGKSQVINSIYDWAQPAGKKIQVTALTGCAAINVGCGATTLHSWAGIRLGLDPPEETADRVSKSAKMRKNWCSTDILVIDEVSMLSKKLLQLLDFVGRRIRCCPRPFGGIQVVFAGDFFQLPPIRNNGDVSGDSGRFCFESPLWTDLFVPEMHIQLTTIFRQSDPVFQTLLNEVRWGKCSDLTQQLLFDRLRTKYDSSANGGIVPTKIYSTRNEVAAVNQIEFDKLSSVNKPPVFKCQKRVDCGEWLYDKSPFSMFEATRVDAASYMEKDGQLEFMLAELPCEEALDLKVGAIVMCITNLDMANEICNGSTGIVTGFTVPDRFPIVRFNNGHVTPIQMHWWQSSLLPCCAIGQVPLKLAWAMSTHKAQGVTLTCAMIDIGPKVFCEGQAYVSLSRVKTLDGLYLSSFEPKRIRANPKVSAFYESLPVFTFEYEVDEPEPEPEPEDVKTYIITQDVNATHRLYPKSHIICDTVPVTDDSANDPMEYVGSANDPVEHSDKYKKSLKTFACPN